LAKRTRQQLLADLRRIKRNRTVADVAAVLKAYGFEMRKPTKEGSVWSKGAYTLTLPSPHGGDKVLHPGWVGLTIRMVEAADIAEEDSDDE
jgi:hypothetical protein